MSIGNCDCCGNELINRGIGIINSYWLQGQNYVYRVYPECWVKPFRMALFLNRNQDISKKLLKKFGLSLGYTKEEISA